MEIIFPYSSNFMITLLISLTLAFAGNDELNDLVKNSKIGILSTTYEKVPFNSLVPYIVDSKGHPIIFISDLAQHTDNLSNDSKCSFMIYKIDGDNLFDSARVTFVGKMVRLPKKERKKWKAEYLAKHPKSKQFIDFGDFHFYRMEIKSIYYIGGFGDIGWIELEDYNKEFNGK